MIDGPLEDEEIPALADPCDERREESCHGPSDLEQSQGESLGHFLRGVVALAERQHVGVVAQNGIKFELAVADGLVFGEDDPALGGDFRKPDVVFLIRCEVLVVHMDDQIGQLAECFGEDVLSEAAIDEDFERVIPLGPIARTGSLLQFRELFAHSPSPGR